MSGVLAVQLLLVAIPIAAALSLLFPSPGIAVLLAGLSAAWLPANNGHLEGRVLVVVAENHGLTEADLLAYAGLALALLAGWRWRRNRLRTHGAGARGVRWPAMTAFVAVVVFLFGCGLAASWVTHRIRNIVPLGSAAAYQTGPPTPSMGRRTADGRTVTGMSEQATKLGPTARVPAASRLASRPTSDHAIEEATQ